MNNSKECPRFPVFISLERKKILVVGGGKIAERRIKVLLEFGGAIYLVSPEITKDLEKLAVEGKIIYKNREYQPDDIAGSELVLALTNSREVNKAVGEKARELGIYASIGDKKEESTFYFPGTVTANSLVAGIVSTRGDHKSVKEAVKKLKFFWKEEQD